MTSEKFRRQLRQESEKWRDEGLIDAAFYNRLADRYQFTQLDGEASNRFVAILIGLGAILMGLAAITFVAANWQVWSRSLKVILLLCTFISINAIGFYLWRKPASQPGFQRLGVGLLLLGALLLGANLALMSQLFHQSGDLYGLLVVWGLGVLAMAYSLRLTLLGVLSVILILIAYCFSWASSTVWTELSGVSLVIRHLPLVVSAAYIPLAYWCRSRVIFGLSAIAIAVSWVFNFRLYAVWQQGWLIAIALVLPPALLWSYSDRIWQRRSSPADRFRPVAQSLAIWSLGFTLYLFSFNGWWDHPNPTSWSQDWDWRILIDTVVLAIVTGLGWLELRYELFSRQRQERTLNSRSVAIILLIMAFGLISYPHVLTLPTLVFNLLLFTLAILLIWDGLTLTQRATFWGGMVLLVLGIISRSLEYDTGLLLKAIVLAACGIGVITAGLWFERRLRPPLSASLPPSSPEDQP